MPLLVPGRGDELSCAGLVVSSNESRRLALVMLADPEVRESLLLRVIEVSRAGL